MNMVADGKQESAAATAASNRSSERVVWRPRFPLSKLTSPDRVTLIVNHRKTMGRIAELFSLTWGQGGREGRRQNFKNIDTVNPAGRDRLPWNFNGLTPINIRDMDPDECTYSLGNKITLEMIEAAQQFSRVMLMGQDSLGDVVYVALYCDSPSTQDYYLQEKIGYGCKISIANPLMKIALDGRTMIRVDDDAALFIHKEKDLNKCRFCAKPNAEHRCARCKKASYCSRECQTQDWKVLKHKLVCDSLAA